MKTFGAIVALVAGVATAFGPLAATAQDALRDAVTEQQRQSETDDPTDLDATEDATEPALLGDDELDELVSPVALYPDALLAQVLVAASYPLQVVEAERFIGESESMSDPDLAEALKGKTWDPSILVLASGFPTVIKRMSDDLEWTDRLGRAMVNQDDDVLAAVQRKRAEAKELGYLADNAAQTVETNDSGDISIVPADPKVVYVPTYDPEAVYTSRPTTQPYVAPVAQATTGGFHPDPLLTGALAFGAALLVTQLFGNDHDDDNDDGWDDYWHRRQFDWRDRQFYPRPRWQWADDRPDHPWGWERDRYWDPRARRWDRGGPMAVRAYDDDRRDTLGWLVVDDPRRPDPWVRGFHPSRQRANDEALRQAERQAAERRRARLEAQQREDRRARQAEEAREARIAAERREARQKAAAEHRARSDADTAKARAERRARAEADAKAKSDAEARAKAQADRRAKAQADAKAKADADARAKAQADRRAKAQADARAKSDAEARAKAQADRRAKAQADAKAKADADARTKAQADRRAKAQADARAKADADARAKAQAERRARAQADAKAKAKAQAERQQKAQAREPARTQRQEQQRPKQAKCRPNDAACLKRQN